MDPLNKKERTEAFIKMLLMFILTLIIVLVPMYYVFRMPANEQAFTDEEHKRLMEILKENNLNDQQFLLLTDSARSLYLEYSKEESDLNKGRITDRFSGVLNSMEDVALKVEADTVRSELYGHLIDAYSNLFMVNDDINKLKGDLIKTKDELKKTSEEKETIKVSKTTAETENTTNVLTREEQQIQLIKTTLEKNNGNIKNAAKDLGMTERRLKMKMEELGI
jgi:hypothetical protein